jgi:hypothetical protein
MFPAVQMHQMVPPPLDFLTPHHGHYSTYQHGHPPSQLSQVPHGPSSTPRAFAARTTQNVPALHRITTSFSRLRSHEQAENSLRRKTPNGTIDNGYDGSLTHLASGPPPSKHLIIPASTSRIYPTPMIQRAAPAQPIAGLQQPQQPQQPQQQQQHPPGNPWPYAALPPTGAAFDSGVTPLPPDNRLPSTPRGWGPGPLNTASDLRVASGTGFPQQPVPRPSYPGPSFQPLLGQGYQQQLSPTVYSPGGLPQPAIWRDGSLGYQTFLPLANGYTHQHGVDGGFMASHPTMHHALVNAPVLGQNPYFSLRAPTHPPLENGFTQYGHGQLAHQGINSIPPAPDAVFPMNPLPTGDLAEPARFREWVLQRAQKAYSDLLVYLANFKKSHHDRSSHGARTSSSRMMVYPKPVPGSTANKPESGPAAFGQPPPPSYVHQATQETAVARALSLLPNPDAVQNAKQCLSLLSTICEETGWRWFEGVIIGGCLHYFLEHYEVALEWFKRIVNLDPK